MDTVCLYANFFLILVFGHKFIQLSTYFESHNRIWGNLDPSKKLEFEGTKWNSLKFDHVFGWQDLEWNLPEDLESACLVGRMWFWI